MGRRKAAPLRLDKANQMRRTCLRQVPCSSVWPANSRQGTEPKNRAQEPSPRTEPQNRAQEPSQRTMPTPPRLQLPDVNAGKAGRLHISFELAKCLEPIFPQALRWMGGHPAALQEMWTHGSAPRAPRFARRAHRAKSAAARGRGEEA